MHARSGVRPILAAAFVAMTLAAGSARAEVAMLAPEEIVARSSRVTFTAGAASVTCEVTLAGTLTEEVRISSEATVGSITEANISGCSGGTIETPLALPWTITYSSTLGALPERATGLLLQIHGFQVRVRDSERASGCLATGVVSLLVPFSEISTSSYLSESAEAQATIPCSCKTESIRGSFSIEEGGGERAGIIIIVLPAPPGLKLDVERRVNFRRINGLPTIREVTLRTTAANVRPEEPGIAARVGVWAVNDVECLGRLFAAVGERCRIRIGVEPGEAPEGMGMHAIVTVTYKLGAMGEVEGVLRFSAFAIA